MAQMAAEAIISTVLEVILSKAISMVEKQINLHWGFKNELDKLRVSLTMTHAFLRDAETKQVDVEAVQVWLKQLRKIACKADDVLDELAYEDIRMKVETQWRKKVRNFLSISKNPIIFCFKMPQIVKGIKISFDEINAQARSFGLQQRVQTLPPLPRGSQTTHSFVDSLQVVGREADVSKIIELLIGSSTQQTFSMISIVGMGGLGKTTLAKSVYNDERTKNYFNQRMWVCVSENFDVERILKEMLESLTGKTCDLTNRNAILEKIQKELEGKTYLLTLDDVWDRDDKTWEDLRDSLLGINENKRSSILVTSRCKNVAVVRETPQENRYSLKILTDGECWAIIKNRAFLNSSISPELEGIGWDIARKCAGVPLVATIIGGTMCNKWSIDEWESLRDSSLWGSLEMNDRIVHVLKFSFDRLPSSSLKQCFLYCSIFPKDFRIQKEQLIQLWMAEGFLQQAEEKSQQAFEDIGNKYFDDLLSNSLLQDVEKDLHGCITGCKMHDLVHDLAQSITKKSETNDTSRSQQQDVFDGVKLWRSLFSKSINVVFKDLRVLNFCHADISSLPDSIGRLKHLRYFDISNTSISRLPKSICQLYHLQTLRLLSCGSLEKLPKEIKNLISLRHLYVSHERHVPEEIGCLTNLQTLTKFDVGEKRKCGIVQLGCLSELGGELDLSSLENVKNKEEAQRAKIWEKKNLHTLKYRWYYGHCNTSEEVLEGLKPHSNLKSLTIENYDGCNYPSWLGRISLQLINLVNLKLGHCDNLNNFPTVGQYPNLKFLDIRVLRKVRRIGNEFYINDNNNSCESQLITLFPALEKFTLKNIRVEEWLDVVPTFPVFPSLKKLKIHYCPHLIRVPVMSRFSSLQKLVISECYKSPLIGDGLFPSSIKELEIKWCEKLGFIPNVEGGISFLQQLRVRNCDELRNIEEGLLASACLRDVWICECPKLTSISLNPISESLSKLELEKCNELREIGDGLSACTRLEQLRIADCPKLISIPSIDGFSSLSSLRLHGCEGLTSLPSGLQTCTSLARLEISNCTNLKSIPEDVGKLQSLRDLCITNCKNLKRIPEESLGYLTRLKTLKLGAFSDELEEFPGLTSICHLCSSLENLTLSGWEKLSFLPDQLQHLTALKDLQIENFNGVEALPEWLGNLSSLLYLTFQDCENLGHLPSKEAMQRLSNLQNLDVSSCLRLKENSAELSKISHIHIPLIV